MSIDWELKKIGYGIYRVGAGAAIRLLKFPEQEMIIGTHKTEQAAEVFARKHIKSIMIVCSRSVHRSGLLEPLFAQLKSNNIRYVIYEDIQPNPTTDNVEDGYKIYLENACEGILTIGGGSPMDCAKGIGIRATSPNLTFKDMKHMLKIRHRLPFTVAIPTTAGTGSESTVAAVISNPKEHDKYAIVSPLLMPHCVILDEELTRGLPAAMTAATGMDALTHAIEAYIGRIDTEYTNHEALEAIKLIFKYLDRAVEEPNDAEAREQMLIASNKAGAAFTRVYVGYVHSVSHALSALYNVGHGKTNAIVLPYMLEAYGDTIYKKMGKIARYIGMGGAGESDKTLTELLISEIRNMNERYGIPTYVEELLKEDIGTVVKKALKEGNPQYPVPKVMDFRECRAVVKKLYKKQ